MNPLNDDELDALLKQAKANVPAPSPDFAARVMQGYQEQSWRPSSWGWFLFRPVRVPAAFVLLAALILVAVGAVVGRTLLAPSVIAQTRVEVPVIQERVVYRECSSPSHAAESPAPAPPPGGFTFNELQPVRQIQPRVVRSMRDDQ